MKMAEPKRFYGIGDTERLEFDDPDEAVDRFLDDAVNTPGESFESVAERVEFPVKVHEYAPMKLPRAQQIADDVIEQVFGSLDEEYSDPDGDGTEPTEAIKAAALAFGHAVVADYVPWACEQTGKVIEYTREQCREIYGPAEPATSQPAGKCECEYRYHKHLDAWVCGKCGMDANGKPAGNCEANT